MADPKTQGPWERYQSTKTVDEDGPWTRYPSPDVASVRVAPDRGWRGYLDDVKSDIEQGTPSGGEDRTAEGAILHKIGLPKGGTNPSGNNGIMGSLAAAPVDLIRASGEMLTGHPIRAFNKAVSAITEAGPVGAVAAPESLPTIIPRVIGGIGAQKLATKGAEAVGVTDPDYKEAIGNVGGLVGAAPDEVIKGGKAASKMFIQAPAAKGAELYGRGVEAVKNAPRYAAKTAGAVAEAGGQVLYEAGKGAVKGVAKAAANDLLETASDSFKTLSNAATAKGADVLEAMRDIREKAAQTLEANGITGERAKAATHDLMARIQDEYTYWANRPPSVSGGAPDDEAFWSQEAAWSGDSSELEKTPKETSPKATDVDKKGAVNIPVGFREIFENYGLDAEAARNVASEIWERAKEGAKLGGTVGPVAGGGPISKGLGTAVGFGYYLAKATQDVLGRSGYAKIAPDIVSEIGARAREITGNIYDKSSTAADTVRDWAAKVAEATKEGAGQAADWAQAQADSVAHPLIPEPSTPIAKAAAIDPELAKVATPAQMYGSPIRTAIETGLRKYAPAVIPGLGEHIVDTYDGPALRAAEKSLRTQLYDLGNPGPEANPKLAGALHEALSHSINPRDGTTDFVHLADTILNMGKDSFGDSYEKYQTLANGWKELEQWTEKTRGGRYSFKAAAAIEGVGALMALIFEGGDPVKIGVTVGGILLGGRYLAPAIADFFMKPANVTALNTLFRAASKATSAATRDNISQQAKLMSERIRRFVDTKEKLSGKQEAETVFNPETQQFEPKPPMHERVADAVKNIDNLTSDQRAQLRADIDKLKEAGTPHVMDPRAWDVSATIDLATPYLNVSRKIGRGKTWGGISMGSARMTNRGTITGLDKAGLSIPLTNPGNAKITVGPIEARIKAGKPYVNWSEAESAYRGALKQAGFVSSSARNIADIMDAMEVGLDPKEIEPENKSVELVRNRTNKANPSMADFSMVLKEELEKVTRGARGSTYGPVKKAWGAPDQKIEGGVSKPAMMTKDMEAQLRGLGYAQNKINKMTPEDAWKILNEE